MPILPNTDLNRCRVRFLEQLLIEATACHWQTRAAEFEAARPRPDDYNGRATQADLAALDERCRRRAENCRSHAALILSEGMPGAAAEALLALSEAETRATQ